MKYIFVAMMLFSAPAIAKHKPEPAWYCFKGEDTSGMTVENCERTQHNCEIGIPVAGEFNKVPVCVPHNSAYVFSFRHKDDDQIIKYAFPDLGACIFTAEDMIRNESDVIITSKCKVEK